MNSISIWKDKILLHWDGITPSEAPAGSIHEPADVLHFWKELNGFARFSSRCNAFMLNFGKQNLQRIHRQFGSIPLKSGRDRVDALKARNSVFVDMIHTAQKVKELPFDQLPQYPYKLKPLGEYQHREVVFLCNVKRAPIFADCGCLAGDSMISINTNGKGFKMRLDKLFDFFHKKSRKSTIRVRAFDGQRIRLHTIHDVVESGLKETFVLKLNNGKQIRATGDHLIMTDRDWVPLEQLQVGDRVMVDSLTKHKKTGSGRAKKLNGDQRIAVGKYHPYARKQLSHEGRSHSFLLEIHRAIYEASLNNMSLEQFVELTYKPITKRMKFINPRTHHIHHKNHDHYDNRIENLESILRIDHARVHTKGYLNFKHGVPEYSEVVSVTPAGKTMTYDICCDAPHHNFVANGIVVHNSGKTFCVLTSTEFQINKGLIQPGKTLIVAKLATLETGWLEDAEKFTDLKVMNLWLPQVKNRKEKIIERLNSPADVYLINHDGLRIFEEELIAKRFQKVVVDESTILKGFHGMDPRIRGGQFGRALMNVSQNADWRVIMSGTPAPNGPKDLWGQLYFLDPEGLLLEANFKDFMTRFYDMVDLRPAHLRGRPLGPRDPKKEVPKPAAIEEVAKLINPLTYRVRIRDHIHDLPELTVSSRKVEMSAEQYKHYWTMKEMLKVDINDARIAVSIRLAQMMKLRQITGGFIIDHEEKAHEITPNPKMEELDSLIHDEIDGKVVIYAEYRWEIESILNRYKQIVSVYGGNTPQKNLENIRKFREDPETRLIVLHPKSAAHGITFTMAHHLVFYSCSFSAEDNYQCIKRIERAGQKNAMFVFYLIGSKSVDEMIYKAIQIKNLNQEKLIDQNQIDEALLNLWRTNDE